MNLTPSRDGPRVNKEIASIQVRLIDQEGENVGIVATAVALEQAVEAGLDLVEISPGADPPVAKILDYGRFKYEDQKKKNEARKKQKVIEVKEIKMRPNIDQHDYDVKMRSINRFILTLSPSPMNRSINRFIGDGDKVKVTLRFRGREMVHQELGLKVLNRVREQIDEIAKVEQFPRMEGRQMIMIVAPR
ncbi:MAG: translation initiation factor IF-3 [Proteobacteria bacterium]|nr:translation initiation factor IF-3 [Pseudomonadota bacterium]